MPSSPASSRTDGLGKRVALPTKVFVSHSALDGWVARQIAKGITATGARCFLYETIGAGEDFEDRILEALRTSTEVLVLLTPWSLNRRYVWMELGAAWELRKLIVGIVYGMTVQDLVAQEGTPTLLKRTNLLHIDQLERFYRQLGARVRESKRRRGRS